MIIFRCIILILSYLFEHILRKVLKSTHNFFFQYLEESEEDKEYYIPAG